MPHATTGNDPELILESIDHDHVIACLYDTCLCVWAGPVTAASLKRCSDALRSAASRHPDGVTMLGVVQTGAPMAVSHDARVWLASMLHEHADHLRGLGILIQDVGLDRWLRGGLLSSLSVATRGPQLHELSDRTAALAWAHDHSRSATVTETRLADALATLEARLLECRDPSRPTAHSTEVLPTSTAT